MIEGTIQFSLGQAELLGEKDILIWDSSMTESNGIGLIDMFNKQALMNGERVPILFTSQTVNLMNETNGSLWHGNTMNDKTMLPLTTVEDQNNLPLATRYLNCDVGSRDLCSERSYDIKYDSHCWVPRSDYKPILQPDDSVRGKASWHPGFRYHQFESRKLALTVLEGFRGAFQLWEKGIREKGFPLQESYWHIGSSYQHVQNNLKSKLNSDRKNNSQCEDHFKTFGLERVCRLVMHGMSEFAPINLGRANSIHAHISKSSSKELGKQDFQRSKAYNGVDLFPLSWKVQIHEVDVHAIAIVTHYKPHDKIFGRDMTNATFKSSQLLSPLNGSTEVPNEFVRESGWKPYFDEGREKVVGYCDGSTNSFECHRSIENSKCLLDGHNDAPNSLSGDGLSGWLLVNIPKLQSGLIVGRVEVSLTRQTQWNCSQSNLPINLLCRYAL